VSSKRPINADEPARPPTPEAVGEKGSSAPKPASPAAKKPQDPAPKPQARRPKPLAPKLLALLVVIAVAFIAIAVVGGTGGGEEEPSSAGPPAATAELGFPALATANTTRVGGADPAANAAAVALAVYPSTSESQRPRSVALVDEGNWAGALAAGVLMATPVRAPLLFTAGGEQPAATEEALSALEPGKVHRIPDEGAAASAAAVAKLRDRLFPDPPKHIVIAPEGEPELAAPAAAWAARSGDPVLFAGGDELPAPTAAYLEKHPKRPIFVLGPSSALSSKVVREAERVGGAVSRVAGEDPVAGAIAFARYSKDGFGWNINDPGHGFVLVRAGATLDAAAAAPLSGAGTWGPLLLTDDADTLPGELREYFLDVKPGYTDDPTRAFYNHVWVIGDQEAIDVNQQAEVNELAELARIGDGR